MHGRSSTNRVPLCRRRSNSDDSTTPRELHRMTRAGFFRLHSWLGVVTGICMLLIAWSGSVVVFNDEIEWLLNPAVRGDPAAPLASIDDALAAIQSRHPDRRVSLNLQIGPRWAHVGYAYDGPMQWFLQIDPATAAIRTDVPMRGYTFNVAYFLRQLHVRLLMGAWGRIFVGVFGVTLVLSVITSLVIYRQWWRSLFRIRRHDGPRIFQMDLHKAIGAWSLVFSLMFGVTGAILGLENLYNRIWPPARGGPLVSTELSFTIAPRLTPSGIVAALVSRDPEFVPSVIDVSPEGRVVVRGNHPGAFIAKGASSFTVTRATGEVTSVVDARRLRWPAYLYNLLDPLHFGYFGERWGFVTGYIVEGLWCLIGLAPGALALTGGMMWLLRQRRRERSTTAAIVPAGRAAPRRRSPMPAPCCRS